MESVEAEVTVFGVDNVSLASAAAKKWGLPEELIEGLRYTSLSAEGPTPPLAGLTAIADFIASCATEGWDAQLENSRLPGWAFTLLNVPDEKIDALVHEGLAVIASSSRND